MTNDSNTPKLKGEWRGRHVRLLRRITTRGGTIFERGEILKVDKNYKGLTLERTSSCPQCGRMYSQSMVGISERWVGLLPADYKPNFRVQDAVQVTVTPEEQAALYKLRMDIFSRLELYGPLVGLMEKIEQAAEYDTPATKLPEVDPNEVPESV